MEVILWMLFGAIAGAASVVVFALLSDWFFGID